MLISCGIKRAEQPDITKRYTPPFVFKNCLTVHFSVEYTFMYLVHTKNCQAVCDGMCIIHTETARTKGIIVRHAHALN
jgi:hypothetical protein